MTVPGRPGEAGGGPSVASTDAQATFEPIAIDLAHHALGPRPAYLIGSTREDGSPHLCSASYVTCVGNSPQIVVIGLAPAWETTRNIRRTGEATISLVDSSYVDALWIAGHRASGVDIRSGEDKFSLAGLSRLSSRRVTPCGVAEALAILECMVVKEIADLTDHVILLANIVVARQRRSAAGPDGLIDLEGCHPLAHLAANRFAEAWTSAGPDTDRCNKTVVQRRRTDNAAQ